MQTQVQSVSKLLTKTQFFIIFWTLVLGPFEYLVLGLPLISVIMIRVVAIGSNMLWYKYWFERKFWDNYLPKEYSTEEPELPISIRISRMVSMKFFVNVSNFTLLFCITLAFASIYDTGLHFTLMGFLKKVGFITLFAVVLTTPYEWLLKKCGFENNNANEVDVASDF
jgi:hypothetical protein